MNNWADRYFGFLEKRIVPLHVLLVFITAVSLMFASKLQLKTDFSELLPDKLASVRSFKKVDQRLGGTGLLIIGVVSPDFEANRKFVEAVAKRLDPLVGKELRYYEYRYQDVRSYAEKYAPFYLNIKQLTHFRDSLKERVRTATDKSVGSFLGLDDDAPKSASASEDESLFKTLTDDSSFDPNVKAFYSYRDAYLSAENGKVLAMSLRPPGSSLGVGDSQILVDKVQSIIRELNPKSFNPQMRTTLTGSVPQALAEFETIRSDIVDTAVMLTVLILAVLFLFFWSLRLVGLLLVNLLFAVVWTFALTQLHIGYLNAQTAFLGSLVAGTGINYGIIFVCRYLEARHEGKATRASIIEGIRGTMFTTLIASLTTAVSFGSLLTAENKGFSQFGFIGGVGILLCWLAAFTILPVWLFVLEKRFPSKRSEKNPLGVMLKPYGYRFGHWITRRAPYVLGALGVFTVFCAFGVRRLVREPLEYNFDNVRNRYSVTTDEEALRQRVYGAFPVSLTPSIIFSENETDARRICPAVRAEAATLPPEKNIVSSCAGLYDMLPPPVDDLAGHQKLITEIRGLLGAKKMQFSESAETLQRMSQNMSLEPPSMADLPPQLVRRFTERDGRTGLYSYVSPDNDKPLNDGRNLLSFTGQLEAIQRQPWRGEVFVAGDSFILADLLRGISKDGPKLTLISFVGVVVLAVLLCNGLLNGALMTFCLVCAIGWMLGVQGWLGLKYNFFNFIALPLTFGIGIDYPVNVFIRCRQEKFRDYGRIFAGSGMAVTLCSMTTIIGYYTLLQGASLALAGFGKLAIIGEIGCLVAALFLVPAILRVRGHFTT